jgi:hypothetical protein
LSSSRSAPASSIVRKVGSALPALQRKELTMTMLKAAMALAAIAVPAAALAHTPVDTPYETRGDCEAQMAQDNIFHARDKVEQGTYKDVGDAMADMHEHFWCEQDPDTGLWYMLRTPF